MSVETRTVSFTAMKDGTKEDYDLLSELESEQMDDFADRVLGWLRTMDDSVGYQISRLEHSLQAATRALRAGEDEETVVCVLLHDIGDYLAPANHSEVAAAVLRPYVCDKNYWIVKHHGVFQGFYYFHHIGAGPQRADRWKDHPYYQATVDFCEYYDQNSFDPKYEWEPLELLRADGAPHPVRAAKLRGSALAFRLLGDVPAIHDVVRPGDVGRALAGQERDQLGNLFAGAESTDRVQC